MTEAALSERFERAAAEPPGSAWSSLDELRRKPVREIAAWLEKTLPIADDDPRIGAAQVALARLGLPAFFTREQPPLARLHRRPAARYIALARAYHFEERHDFDGLLKRPGALRYLLLQFCGARLLKELALERGRRVRIFDPGRVLLSSSDVALSLFCDRGLSEAQLVERLRREYEQADHERIRELRRRLQSREFLDQLPQTRMQFGEGDERQALNRAANSDGDERALQLERLVERREQHDVWSFVKTDLNAVLEDLFFGHARVCPRLEERVAHADLLLRENGRWQPYDLKSTYLPPSFISELRAAMSLEAEDALLRRSMREQIAAGRLDEALERRLSTEKTRPLELFSLLDELKLPRALRQLKRELEEYRGELISRLAAGEEWLVRRLLSSLYANQGSQRFSNNPRIIVVAATPTLTPNDVLLLADLKRLERAVGEFLETERAPYEISYEQRKGGLGVVHSTRAHLILVN